MPLARHDLGIYTRHPLITISTHMPLARHDIQFGIYSAAFNISTHMPLARHDADIMDDPIMALDFYSHASCEA